MCCAGVRHFPTYQLGSDLIFFCFPSCRCYMSDSSALNLRSGPLCIPVWVSLMSKIYMFAFAFKSGCIFTSIAALVAFFSFAANEENCETWTSRSNLDLFLACRGRSSGLKKNTGNSQCQPSKYNLFSSTCFLYLCTDTVHSMSQQSQREKTWLFFVLSYLCIKCFCVQIIKDVHFFFI